MAPRAHALVDASLLSPRDTEITTMFGNKVEPATEYQLTDASKKYLVSSRPNTLPGQAAFCTGKHTLIAVDNVTEPGEIMGVRMSQVRHRDKVEGAANWIKSPTLRTNYL